MFYNSSEVKQMNTQVAEILQLSVAERVLIVEEIWDSIANNPEELTLSESEKTELNKRLENYEKNPNEGISWETLKRNFSQTK
jgi:putative addiction module component (TIGR02574 family)